jgi:hypothetical protein
MPGAGPGSRTNKRLDGPVDRRVLITPAAGSDSQQSHEIHTIESAKGG